MSENKIKDYATAIYQNAMTGIQSIRDIEGKVEDPGLKRELTRELNGFNTIAEKLNKFSVENDFVLKENNFLEKSRLWMSINMATLMDSSTRHISEMMLLGTVMGLITCYKDKHDHKQVSEELDKILEELEKQEDENYLNLKSFLKEL